MKQIKILGVLAIALTLGLAGCGKGNSGEAEHVHTFDTTKWESNSSEHWHPATCEHTKEKGDKAKHTWGDPYEVQKPTCTEAGSQKLKCTVCEYVKTETLKATGHSAQPAEGSADWTIVTEATCEGVGSKTYVCANCKQAIPVEIPALGHNFKKDAEGNDVIEWTTAPTCTEAGVGGHRTCERCNQEVPVSDAEAAALGHNFKKDADGNEVITWTVEPSCELPGKGTKHCERCNQDVSVTEEEAKPLGHDIEAIGGETAPTDGTAAVRLYKCKRCGEIYMGFLANEVSNESKTHVAFEPATVTGDEEQGARFLGRPIGNALALDEEGTSINKTNGECVYCSTETGDFIEYQFKLNAAQAATLSTCRLYCDAKPANHLNGTDFWAYGRSNDEWTPGFYIDGGDERFEKNEDGTFKMVKDHARVTEVGQPGAELENEVRLGKRIEDYRYVLYVDDVVQDFDPDTENPTHGNGENMTREEFVMPYTFHLHEGLNKIKLVMAGGYRSLFYKFIFRPYVEPTPLDVTTEKIEIRQGETAKIENTALTGLVYESANKSIATVDETGLVTGVGVGSTTITVTKEGNYKRVKIPVTINEKFGVVKFEAEQEGFTSDPADAVKAGNIAQWGTTMGIAEFAKDATYTVKFNAEKAGKFDLTFTGFGSVEDLATAMSVKMNGVDVVVSGSINTSWQAATVKFGQADLVLGENTLSIKALGDVMPKFDSFRFTPAPEEPPVPEHVHTWGEKQTVAATEGCVAYDKYECTECHQIKIEVALNDSMLAEGSVNKNDPAGYMKLKSNNQSFSFTFKYDKAATGKIYQRGVMDSWSSNKSRNVFSGKSGGADDFELTVNGTKVDLSSYKSKTYAEIMPGTAQDGNLSPLTDVESGAINLVNGNNTITYKRLASYNLALTHIVFIVE